jgi:hypothetical protein
LSIYFAILSICGKQVYSEVDTDNRNQIKSGKVPLNLGTGLGADIIIKGTKAKAQTDFNIFIL